MEICVAVALVFASGVGPHYSPRFSTGASPPKAGGGVTLRGQRLDFLLECLFAGKSGDQFLIHQRWEVLGGLWSPQPVAAYSTPVASKSTDHENRTFFCRQRLFGVPAALLPGQGAGGGDIDRHGYPLRHHQAQPWSLARATCC